MSKTVRKLESLGNEKAELIARLKQLEQQEERERQELRLAQIQALGEAVMQQLDEEKLGKDFLATLPFKKKERELFSTWLGHE